MALQPTAQQMTQWLEQCKPMIKDKMRQNIDVRADKLNEVINASIQGVLCDTKSIFQIPSALVQSAKKELWLKVDNWAGLGCFRKQQHDFKSYKKNADNWWNRHKAEWIGDHLFHPLLTNIIPNYIIDIIDVKRDHFISNPIDDALYNLLYFNILYAIFHAEISFARTKFLPLILDQSLCPKKCKHTLQPLFTALGHQHSVAWSNAHIDQGYNARVYSQQWVSQVLKQSQSVYQQILHDESVDMKMEDVNNLYLDASGVITDGYVMDSPIVTEPFFGLSQNELTQPQLQPDFESAMNFNMYDYLDTPTDPFGSDVFDIDTFMNNHNI